MNGRTKPLPPANDRGRMTRTDKPRLRRLAARHFVLYGLDMGVAIAGWVIGFGLTVHNWPALILLCLGLRWIFSVLVGMFTAQDDIDDRHGALRDRFAGLAMQAQLTTDGQPGEACDALIEGAADANRDPIDHLALTSYQVADAMLRARTIEIPIDMVLDCPHCGRQHVDAPDPGEGWTNPPHRSHKCGGCGATWRPADVATNGVKDVVTKGKSDTYAASRRPV